MLAEGRPGALTVRRVRPEEYEAAGEVTVEAYRADDFIGDDNGYEQTLRDVARRDAEAEVLVAIDEAGTLLGTATYIAAGSPWADRARQGEAELRMLGVAAQARGRGVGEALVRACLERARSHGLERLVLSTQSRMRAAQRLYVRLGFQRAPTRDWSPGNGLQLMVYEYELTSRRVEEA